MRKNLSRILATLTVEDARQDYAAIRLAQPGGMGQTSEADISEEPSLTLYQAMALAQERDSIAHEYVSDFANTFEIGYPALREAWRMAGNPANAIVQCHLTLLADVPDTLIARKRGMETGDRGFQLGGENTGAGRRSHSTRTEGISRFGSEAARRAPHAEPRHNG